MIFESEVFWKRNLFMANSFMRRDELHQVKKVFEGYEVGYLTIVFASLPPVNSFNHTFECILMIKKFCGNEENVCFKFYAWDGNEWE